MLERLIDTLFWDRPPGRRMRVVWLVLILLAPLAMAGSVWLQRRVLASVPVRIEVDRNDAIGIARAFAERRGVDTTGFVARLRTHKDWRLYRYLVATRPDLADQVGYWGFLQVMLREGEGAARLEVDIEPHGKVLGHRFSLREMAAGPFSLERARSLADATLASRKRDWPFLETGDPEVIQPKEATTAGTYSFLWPVKFRGLPGLTGKLTVRIQYGRVVEDAIETSLSGSATSGLRTVPRWLGAIPFALYIVFLFFYILYRFVRRKIQKEVSTERLWLVGVLVSVFFTVIQYLGDPFEFEGLVAWTGPALLAMTGLLIGLVGGMFYSACEGDLRERYPNAFTSLDAVLSGRLYTRNVGRAIVLGTVLVAWAFLVRNAIFLLVRPRFAGLDSLESSFEFLFTRIPSLAALLKTPGIALAICLVALLCPLAALHRFVAGKRRVYVALALLTWFTVGTVLEEALSLALNVGEQGNSFGVGAGMSDEALSVAALAIAPMVISAAILWAFFFVDFLASFVVLVGWQLMALAGLSQVAPIWSRHDHWAVLMGVAVLGAAVWAAMRARAVLAEDVRPVYARQIQERMRLQSEMAAAREAQQRLLPSVTPQLPGISIAAVCRPAEQVSGDFYDFYRLSPHRVGVLLSDGGGSGLATALAIALTKGYLMHRSELGEGPAELLRGVAATLGSELRGVSAKGMCYAVIDHADRTLRYARMGATPVVFAAGQVGAVEKTHSHDGHLIHEGFIRLAPAQPVIVYTHGLSRLVGESDAAATNRWLQHRVRDWMDSADRVLDRVMAKALGRKANRALKRDLTLIVVGADERETLAAERVA
ncbi:MAG: SpoIIE family protein phosphatase [Bryobacteraceae bacterium]|nr:SpoIIE family protein phosphatase [Bryobacteraceae bacterium]